MFNKANSSKSPFSALDSKNKSKQSTINSFFSSSTSKKKINRSKSENNIINGGTEKQSRFFSQVHSSQVVAKSKSNDPFLDNSGASKRDAVEVLDDDDDDDRDVKKPKNFKTSLGFQATSFAPRNSSFLTQTTSSILLSSSNSPERKTTTAVLAESQQQTKERLKVGTGKPISSILSMKPQAAVTTAPAFKPSRQRQPPWAMNLLNGSNTANLSKANPRLKSASNSHSQHSNADTPGLYDDISLSDEQEKVVELAIEKKKNIFYTGSAGTGKSLLLKIIIERLIKAHGNRSIAVTASTGLAATNIDGMTINRFAGFGLGLGSVDRLITLIKKNKASMERWRRTKVLIVDEVSMVDSEMFTKLNVIAKAVRSSNRPFGGIQLIITGDFFQLPPVDKNNNGSMDKSNFCFNSEAWPEVIDYTILLTQVFRQKGDSTLINMLNSLRTGDVNDDMFQTMKKLERKLVYDDGILPTELYATRNEVFRANSTRLNSLRGKSLIYRALDSGPDEMAKRQLDSLMAVSRLDLKIGAQVMMLKNQEDYIVNGTIGRVIGFLTISQFAEFSTSFKEFELHTMEDFFEIISTYLIGFIDQNHQTEIDHKVAEIIRTRSTPKVEFLERMIERVKLESGKVQKDYASKDSNNLALDMKSSSYILPIIKFSVNSESKFAIRQITMEDFLHEKRADMIRCQLPLLLSWALSIHKSQGQTLPRVKVDLSKIFEIGQLYVALSRATSADSLEIVNLRRENIKVSENVKRFYSRMKVFQD